MPRSGILDKRKQCSSSFPPDEAVEPTGPESFGGKMSTKESKSAAMLMALVAFASAICLAGCALLTWRVASTLIPPQPGELHPCREPSAGEDHKLVTLDRSKWDFSGSKLKGRHWGAEQVALVRITGALKEICQP